MVICPKCLSREMVKHGFYEGKQRYRCLKCGRTTSRPRRRMPSGRENDRSITSYQQG